MLTIYNHNNNDNNNRSIRHFGDKLWNELPPAMRTSLSKILFKKSLKYHFLNAM